MLDWEQTNTLCQRGSAEALIKCRQTSAFANRQLKVGGIIAGQMVAASQLNRWPKSLSRRNGIYTDRKRSEEPSRISHPFRIDARSAFGNDEEVCQF